MKKLNEHRIFKCIPAPIYYVLSIYCSEWIAMETLTRYVWPYGHIDSTYPMVWAHDEYNCL